MESGEWTKDEENKIKELENFISILQKNKTQLVLKSEIDKQNESMKETRKQINELYEIYTTSPYWSPFPRSPMVMDINFMGENIIIIKN